MGNAPDLPDGLQLGSMGYRVIAAVFDLFAVGLICYPFFHFGGHYREVGTGYQVNVSGLPALAMMFSAWIYWVLTEWLFSASVGKLICDLRVVTLRGEKCSFEQFAKRNLLRAVDFFPFYLIGFIAAKLSPLRQRLGDQWARTIVVKKDRKPSPNAAPEAQPPFS